MKKELKDYLHLYLGCECEIQPFDNKHRGKLVGVNYPVDERLSTRVFVKAEGNFSEVLYGLDECKFKLLLRPLSDMTKEERLEIFHIGESDWRQRHHEFKSDQFIKLLSRGFDLFGLIESGLAIDKTTLK